MRILQAGVVARYWCWYGDSSSDSGVAAAVAGAVTYQPVGGNVQGRSCGGALVAHEFVRWCGRKARGALPCPPDTCIKLLRSVHWELLWCHAGG